MSVAATNAYSTATGNGAATSFPFTFACQNVADVSVYVNGVLQNSGYSVTLNSDFNGGTVLFSVAPANAATIIIASVPAFTQQIQFENAGPYNPASVDNALDAAAIRAIFLNGLLARTALAPVGETMGPLPAKASRAGLFFGFDGNGNPVALNPGGADSSLRTDLAASGGFTLVNLKPQGVVGDGVTNDHNALATADALGPTALPKASYYIGSSLTFSNLVTFAPGAKLIIPTGVTVTFNGGISASHLQQIFQCTGTGAVVISASATPMGWVDWWGTDQVAIMAAHKALTVTRLTARDYIVTATVVLNLSYKQVIGERGSAEGLGGTRIVYAGSDVATATIVQVGTLATDSVNNCARRLYVSNINTIRSGLAAPASTNLRPDQPTGWLIKGLYESEVHDCFAYGDGVSFRVTSTCGVQLRRLGCVQPNAAVSNGFTALYTAFVVGGDTANLGFSGANGSLVMEDCSCAGSAWASRAGLYLYGYIADTWVHRFEQSQMEYGVFVDGNTAAGGTISSLLAHQDVRIIAADLDANLTQCITVQNINAGGGIEIAHPYAGMSSTGSGIYVSNSLGLVAITGGNLIANSSVVNYGINITGSKRVYVNGTLLKDFKYGVKASTSSALRITPVINRANTGAQCGVQLASVSRSYIAPVIDGIASSYADGIEVDSASTYNEVNLTGVNFGAFTTSDAAHKLFYNGATWGGGGTFGTGNVATGVLA